MGQRFNAWGVLCALVLLSLLGCKENELDDLGYNKYLDEVPNPLTVDSIVVYPNDPTSSYFAVHFSFDQEAFESAWDPVTEIVVEIEYEGPAGRPSFPVTVTWENGVGVARPSYAYTLSQYSVRHAVILSNGRATAKSRNRRVDTPGW